MVPESQSGGRFARLTTSPELPVLRPESPSEQDELVPGEGRIEPDVLLLLGNYLRLILVGLGFVIAMLLESQTWAVRISLGLYFLISASAILLLRRGLFPRWGYFVLLLADVSLVTGLTFCHGILVSPIALFYLPLLVGYVLQQDRALSYTALASIVGAYGLAVLADHQAWLPRAPLVDHLPAPLANANGPMTAFLVLALTACATFTFVLVAVRRHEKLAEVRTRLATVERTATSQRLEALGRLAGGVAHDFNNMLMAIKGYTALLQARPNMDAESLADLDEIAKSADRAAGLTAQLLAFARRQVVHPVVLDVNDVIGGLTRMLHHLVGEDVRLETSLGEHLGYVEIDPVHLEQVIMNLVVNARDAMPTGGTITIATRNAEPKTGAETSTWLVEGGGHVLILISDTGQGVDPDALPYIFEPFFSTKGEDKGTGLGLATVYGIVKQVGGQIRVKSEPGRGTTFSIYLPRSTAVDAPAPEAVPELPPRPPRAATVLLAEDDAQVRTLARRMLEQAGYEVLAVGDGPRALRAAREHQGQIALLLTDVVMPGMDGPELADVLRRERPEIKTLFMSGFTDDEVLRRGIATDQVDYLQKPFSGEELLGRIQRTLEGPAWSQAPSARK